MNILKGLGGLTQSRKGTAFLIVTMPCLFLCAFSKLEGQWLAAIIATTFAALAGSHAYQEVNAPTLPDKGKL